MAKDRKPAEDLSGLAAQTMEQARSAVDIYFDYLKKAVSAAPSGGTAQKRILPRPMIL